MKQLIFLIAAFTFYAPCIKAQDQVILLNGDTLKANVSANPMKEAGISKKSMGYPYDYGHARVVVIYNKDSIRIHYPGQIKGFIKKESGKYLGTGFYQTHTVDERWMGFPKGREKKVFLQRVNFHRDIIIWYLREHTGKSMPQRYFFIWPTGAEEPQVIFTYKGWMKWAETHAPFDELSKEVPIKGGSRKKNQNLFNYLQKVMQLYIERNP